jgi:glucokinase
VREYPSQTFSSFGEILTLFTGELKPPSIEAAAVGVAGPIVRQRAKLTNLTWAVSAEDIAAQLGVRHVRLLNDLEAMASSIESLRADELHTLQRGETNADGNAVVMAAGTGLGEAYLPRIDGRMRVLASEAGHADFAARTDRELQLVAMLRQTAGRASVEHVLSGPGLLNLHRFTHRQHPCRIVTDLAADDAPAGVSQAAMDGTCEMCREALAMFVEALGAEAGNLGLRGTATAGVYIGGGIAPRILPALADPAFLAAFRDKAPMHALVERMPVHVILNSDAGLLGAAIVAATLHR